MTARQHNGQEKGPFERADFSSDSNQHKYDCATNQAAENAFKNLRARFDQLGHRLTRTIEPDGTVSYFVGCGSFSREVAGIDAAAEFLQTIGGTP